MEDCPYCKAPNGWICSDTCSENGDKVKDLKKILKQLKWFIDNEWFQQKCISCGKDTNFLRRSYIKNRTLCTECAQNFQICSVCNGFGFYDNWNDIHNYHDSYNCDRCDTKGYYKRTSKPSEINY